MNFITTITDRDTWFFRSSTWFNQIHVDGLSGNDGAIYLNGVNLYGTLSSNANLISGLQSLSGNWEDTYTIMMHNSANWDSVYTTVLANSASWEESTDISYLSGRIDENTNDITNIGNVSANWNSTYTTVNTNSSTTWLGDTAVDSLVHSDSGKWYYQGTDLKLLSANWDSTYTTVQSNSANIWNKDSKSFVISFPTTTGKSKIQKAESDLIITSLDMLIESGNSVTGKLMKYDNNGTNGTIISEISSTVGINSTILNIVNPSVFQNEWIGWENIAIIGAVTQIFVNYGYIK